MFPYLKGIKLGDAHEYLCWLNNQPDDGARRHLIAVRWGDWRLYRKYAGEDWRLYNLVADPTEERDLSTERPALVERLSVRHASWEETLAPLADVPSIRGESPVIPVEHGWATN